MSNLPSIPWTERERAEIRRRLLALEAGGGGGGGPVAWVDVTGKPSTFPPEAHTHTAAQITDFSTAVAGLITGKQDVLVSGLATVTAPNNSREVSATVAATGVTPARRIMLSLGTTLDADENGSETLEVAAMNAVAGTDQITVNMAFLTPVAGPIKLNWMAL